jgi:hypothetical protein
MNLLAHDQGSAYGEQLAERISTQYKEAAELAALWAEYGDPEVAVWDDEAGMPRARKAFCLRTIHRYGEPSRDTERSTTCRLNSDMAHRDRTSWLGRRDSNPCILESVFAQTLSPGARTRICASRIEPHFLQTSQAPDRRLHPVEAR